MAQQDQIGKLEAALKLFIASEHKKTIPPERKRKKLEKHDLKINEVK